ncbi:MAG: ethanolamine ammonia-lyase subunit EutC [Clostridia bacterium]|nr:ethanolamine ammonia-lyase subunit EutC [Deltaproteobacteria bacterium]
MTYDRETIARVVREVLSENAPVSDTRNRDADRTATMIGAAALHASRCERPVPPLHAIDNPADETVIERLVGSSPSQIAVGHRGLRFKTDLYLRMREGHADAKDAVRSEVPDDWANDHGLRPLKSRCEHRDEYLLYPNHGRRLDDASLSAIADLRGSRPDVQLIIGDGLSPNAVVKNGTESLQELHRALGAAGMQTGQDLYVKFARIGVADEIGVAVEARSTVIVVGERPGLGTGDSLSFYIAVAPKLDQDNAEKNCISNVRQIGIKPHEAADLTVGILKRALELGRGGVALGFGFGRT